MSYIQPKPRSLTPQLLPPAQLFAPPAPAQALSPAAADSRLSLSLPAGAALPALSLAPVAAPDQEADLKVREQAERSLALAGRIAHSAEAGARARDTVGNCYAAVAEAIEAHVPPFLWGMSAWMAADQLAASPSFRELSVSGADLPALPAGTVVVWEQGSSPHGHISIALGDGREASDHIAAQMTSHYGGGRPRAFTVQA